MGYRVGARTVWQFSTRDERGLEVGNAVWEGDPEDILWGCSLRMWDLETGNGALRTGNSAWNWAGGAV